MSEQEPLNLPWLLEIHIEDDCRQCFESFNIDHGEPCQTGKKLCRQVWASPESQEFMRNDIDIDEWHVDCRPGAE